MFEKEAEEYAVNTRTQREIEVLNTVQDWGSESLSPEERHLLEGMEDREVAREQGFKDGAEFGYNKANEWHYVKDGDYPKENKKYWVLTSNREPKVDSWLSISWVNSYDVIAWKEIVLPELKESE